jgi:hypothetical protein
MRPIRERRKTGVDLPRSANLSSEAFRGVAIRLDFGPSLSPAEVQLLIMAAAQA